MYIKLKDYMFNQKLHFIQINIVHQKIRFHFFFFFFDQMF